MKAFLTAFAAIVVAVFPAQARKEKKFVEASVIEIATGNTQLLLQVDSRGEVRTVHYGAPVGDPAQFTDYDAGAYHAPDAYSATGGRFFGQEALHVLYADGTHNTELYYVSHETESRQDIVTTTVQLKDYFTALEVD